MVLIFSASAAMATVITFDDQPAGTIITNQYAGVTFSSTSGGGIDFHNGEAGNTNFLIGNPNSFQPITLDFTVPVEKVSLDLISVGWATVTATAFASDLSSVLDTISVTHFPSGPENGLDNVDPITLNGPGIARLRIAITTFDPADGFGIDNVSFGVAEPATMAILGLGLAGLGYIRRRRAA